MQTDTAGTPTEATNTEIFEEIYQTDLVYVPDCWKLCGDAHCCNFSRYKKRFRMIARTPFQELPLLPGEYEFLLSRGWESQFQEFEHRVVEFPLDDFVIRAESVVSLRPGCACDHGTRPTICRLYPLLPVFDDAGQLAGAEQMGIYEEMETIGGLERACQLRDLPFEQVTPFLTLTSALSRSPLMLFYLEAYRRTKAMAARQLEARHQETGKDIFALFEAGFLRKNLLDTDELRNDLNTLVRRFDARYGPEWREHT